MKTLLFSAILALIATPVYANTEMGHTDTTINLTANESAQNQEEKHNKNNTVVIQTGAFNNDDFALSQAARVSLLGVPSKVVKMKKSDATMHVVRSYRMNRPDAEKIVSRLREQDVPAMMIVY